LALEARADSKILFYRSGFGSALTARVAENGVFTEYHLYGFSNT
jgi:hypothetical protein